MAKTKASSRSEKKGIEPSRKCVVASRTNPIQPASSPHTLIAQATIQLQEANLENALVLAKQALALSNIDTEANLSSLNLLGEIHIELGEIETAREYFLRAAEVDEDSNGEGKSDRIDMFLWLAQLSEEGGHDSVKWFDKAATRLRMQIQTVVDQSKRNAEAELLLDERRKKLAVSLCSVVEVYMTDLSWEEDAEQKCEALVTEATMVAPSIAEPWQTLANVRLSQTRSEDAREALRRSLEIWKDLPPGNAAMPDFPTRVSLARLLMEASMETEAIEVLEHLVAEDDNSVEVWYLGGWALYIMGEKQKEESQTQENGDGHSWSVLWVSSQQWLVHCLRLYDQQEYEDTRLKSHAKELVAILKALVGEQAADGDDQEWEDDEGTDDDEMIMA